MIQIYLLKSACVYFLYLLPFCWYTRRFPIPTYLLYHITLSKTISLRIFRTWMISFISFMSSQMYRYACSGRLRALGKIKTLGYKLHTLFNCFGFWTCSCLIFTRVYLSAVLYIYNYLNVNLKFLKNLELTVDTYLTNCFIMYLPVPT